MGSRKPRFYWSDQQVETLVGNLLRSGVLLAFAVVLAGGVIFLMRHGGESPQQYQVFHGEPAELRTVAGIVQNALSLSGRGLIQLGLLLLVATPVMRVAVSLLAFVSQRDWTYVLATTIVLACLLFGLLGGQL
jgi:uncharacterized membrane protein